VANLSSLSAHADYAELLSWLRSIPEPPQRTFVTHGEPAAADAMRRHIEETYHWRCEVPIYLETVELPGTADELAVNSRAGVGHCMPADPDQPAYSVP